MATKRHKRIALTVPPAMDEILTELSKLTNTPKTVIILELMTDLVPSLEQVIKSIKQVKQGQEELALSGMASLFSKATSTGKEALIALDDLKGQFFGKK